MNRFSSILTVVAALAVFPAEPLFAEGQFKHSVRGGGTAYSYLDFIFSINAWLDDNGQAHGMISWEAKHGGYPWHIAVDTMEVADNVAYLKGTVVHSPQSPSDVGEILELLVIDNGNGASGSPDMLFLSHFWLTPIDSGNFAVR